MRTVGSLLLVGLLGLNGWLALLNLAKHDRLPSQLEALPGLDGANGSAADSAGDGVVGVDSGDVDDVGDGAVGDGGAASFSADATVPSGTIEVDDWPGDRGPVPEGRPVPRQVVLTADGGLQVVGSVPRWSVATDLAAALGRRLGRDASTVALDVTWHPEASDRLGDGEVVVGRALTYPAGQIDLPEGGEAALAVLASLLFDHPELLVVAVGTVDTVDTVGSGGDEEAALALGRASVVADELVELGIDADRIVTSVAADGGSAESPDSTDSPDTGVDDEGSLPVGGQVILRIENLLVFGSGS